MRISRLFLVISLAALALTGGYFLSKSGRFSTESGDAGPRVGGRLIATYRSEPASFNRYAASGAADDLLARLIHATLVRLDRTTGKIEARLAREWTNSPDGLTWTFKLREDVTFSDGTPFTAADVVFSFRALYDPVVKSDLASSLLINEQPMRVSALDAHTVSIVFPAPYAPGIALLDALPILPEHKLRAALDAGTFRDAWKVTSRLADIVGLGPFVIQEYKAGERLVFARNPRFFLRDSSGRQLPYLDQLEIQFTPDQNAEVLRLQAGEVDLMTKDVRFEDLASFLDLAKRQKITVHNAGVSISPDMLWFNLDPAARSAKGRPWLQREELRHAISRAVNRTTMVNTVFLGEAVEIGGPVTPGHGEWYVPNLPRPAFDPAQAAKLLASIGLADLNGDGWLDDEHGRTASFSILTQKGESVRERSAQLIQEHLRRVGLQVGLEALEYKSMITKLLAGNYDAVYFAIEFDAFDPARNLDFWLSSKPYHFWYPNQPTPATPWEGRIDALMTQQSTTSDPTERRRLFAEAQRVLAEHEPVLYFAAPKVEVATSARLAGVHASVLAPNVLWNAEMLYLTSSSSGAGR